MAGAAADDARLAKMFIGELLQAQPCAQGRKLRWKGFEFVRCAVQGVVVPTPPAVARAAWTEPQFQSSEQRGTVLLDDGTGVVAARLPLKARAAPGQLLAVIGPVARHPELGPVLLAHYVTDDSGDANAEALWAMEVVDIWGWRACQ